MFGIFAKLDPNELKKILKCSDVLLLVNDEVRKKKAAVSDIFNDMTYSAAVQKFNDNADFKRLCSHLDDFDYTSSFFLISSRLDISQPLCNSIARVPWVKVFDFDVNSRQDGLLFLIESDIKRQRSFAISSEDEVKELSDKFTEWYFPLGMADHVDSKDAEEWYDSYNAVLSKHFDNIVDFCQCTTFPVFVILWYDCDEFVSDCLSWCLSLLFTKVLKSHNRRVLLFCESIPDATSPLHHYIRKHKLQDTTFAVPFEMVSFWFHRAKTPDVALHEGIKLPANSNNIFLQETVSVSREDVAWLEQCLEVVPFEASECSVKNEEDGGLLFVKGGKVTWNNLASGDVAIPREVWTKAPIHDILETEILEDKKSFLLDIIHEPGGGGTTFGRQVLYSMHRQVPCGVVSSNMQLSAIELVERVKFLQKQTSLPVVLLVDGRQHKRLVDQVMEMCNSAVVVLHVQQENSELLKNAYFAESKECTITGRVTGLEADQLTEVFSKFAPERRDSFSRLRRCVVEQGQCRYVVEYGLTAFDSEFTTIRSYVRSYLQLPQKRDGLSNLLPWQKVLSYLSLMNCYGLGQDRLPREMFRNVLGKQKDSNVVTMQDLKFAACELLVLEKKCFWKIRYPVIATEILEQVLCEESNREISDKRPGELSSGARANLHHLALDFIEMVKTALNKSSLSFSNLHMLINLFLNRGYRVKSEAFPRGKKRRFSLLLEHLPQSEHQITILEQLVDAFPDNFEFHAHLGRFYGILNQFEKAELHLQNAIRLLTSIVNPSNNMKNELGQIHNMYGYALMAKVRLEINQLNKESCYKIFGILDLVIRAVQHFVKCSEQVTYNFSYGYIGEIKARLSVAKYVNVDFPYCISALKGEWPSECARLNSFIEESHSKCAWLLERCHYCMSQNLQSLKKELDMCTRDFAMCYRPIPDSRFMSANDIHFLRSRIACLKMQDGRQFNTSVKAISERETVRKIVSLLEQITNKVLSENDLSVSITVEFLQWLDAIRKPQVIEEYLLERILPKMRKWNSRNESVHSTYYLYIVTYLLALFSADEKFCQECNIQAKELRDALKKKRYSIKKPLYLEVVVKHAKPTVKKILSISRDSSVGSKGNAFWKQHKLLHQFQVFTGTVVCYHSPRGGIISIDQSPSKCQVEAFFVPLECNLAQQRWAKERCRVEFFIRFSFERTAEAFAVKKLLRAKCLMCDEERFIITLNQTQKLCISCAA